MTVQELINLSLADVGQTNPTAEETNRAFAHLNLIISNFAWWDQDAQPIYEFSSLSQTINLPAYYLEIFEMLLASRQGLIFGLPMNVIGAFEGKAKQLTDRLVYRRQDGVATDMIPTTFVV